MTVATLGLAVESSSLSAATPALDKMTAASLRAESAAEQLARASRSSSAGMQQLGGAVKIAEQGVSSLATRSVEAGRAVERMSATSVAGFQRVTASIDGMRYQTAGIAAQFQDVGVTAMMGMNPLLIGLQQGTQLAGQLATMANPIKGLGAAFVSLLSPVSLLAIGFTSLLAVGIQWGASLLSASNDAERALADQAMSVDQVENAISSLTDVTDAYARSILDTADNQSMATKAIIANSEKEFAAKKSLLELELKRQDAAVAIARASVDSARNAIVGDISKQTGHGIGADMGNLSESYGNSTVGPWVRAPWQDPAMDRTNSVLSDPSNVEALDKLKELSANLDLAEVAREKLSAGLDLTFSDGVAESIERIGASTRTVAEGMSVCDRIESDLGSLLTGGDNPLAELQSNLDKLGAWLQHEGPAGWDRYAEGVRRANLIATSSVLGSVGQITGILAGAFEDNKLFAAANAAVNTAEGVTKALAQGGMFAWPTAIAIGAAGAAQITSILSAKPGSTSVAGVGAGAAGSAGAPAAQPQSRSVTINLPGSEYVSTATVGKLFERLNDELGVDGLELVVHHKQA